MSTIDFKAGDKVTLTLFNKTSSQIEAIVLEKHGNAYDLEADLTLTGNYYDERGLNGMMTFKKVILTGIDHRLLLDPDETKRPVASPNVPIKDKNIE